MKSTASLITKGYWEKSHYVSMSHTGRWSKWGGAMKEVAINQYGIIGVAGERWFCQSCNTEQPIELTPYLFEWPENERIRVCFHCYNTGCAVLRGRLGED